MALSTYSKKIVSSQISLSFHLSDLQSHLRIPAFHHGRGRRLHCERGGRAFRQELRRVFARHASGGDAAAAPPDVPGTRVVYEGACVGISLGLNSTTFCGMLATLFEGYLDFLRMLDLGCSIYSRPHTTHIHCIHRPTGEHQRHHAALFEQHCDRQGDAQCVHQHGRCLIGGQCDGGRAAAKAELGMHGMENFC